MFDYTNEKKVKDALKWTDNAKAGDDTLSKQEKYFLEALFAFDAKNIDDKDEDALQGGVNTDLPIYQKIQALTKGDVRAFMALYDFSGGERYKIFNIFEDAKEFYDDADPFVG